MIITQLANTTAYAGQSVLLLREAGGLEAGGEEMLLSKEVWSRQENESSGCGRNGLDQVTTTLQNWHSPIQSLLQHSVFNREGCQSQVTLKVAVLRKQQQEIATFGWMSVSMFFG